MMSRQDLPPELVIITLVALIDGSHPKDHSRILKAIVLVSKNWQAIAESTASLWRTLSNEDPPGWVGRVIRNSGSNTLLNARLLPVSPCGFGTEDLICSVVDRWVDLRIVWNHFPYVMLQAPATSLQRLSIYAISPIQIPFSLLPNKLRSLSLDNVAPSWESQPFIATSLQELFVYNIPATLLSLRTLFDILASCTNIVLLSIQNVSSGEDKSYGPPIVMASLTRIELRLLASPITNILERLQLPVVVHHSVNILDTIRAGASYRPAWDRFVIILTPKLTQSMRETSNSDIPQVFFQYLDGWIIKVKTESFQLETPLPPDASLQRLLRAINKVPAAIIYTTLPRWNLYPQLLMMHAIFTTVKYLRLPSDSPDLCLILRATSKGSHGGILPMLSTLDLEQPQGQPKGWSTEMLDNLARVFEKRRSSGGQKDSFRIRMRCAESDVDEGLRRLSRRYPHFFIYNDAEIQWWDRPHVPLDPNYENHTYR